MGLALLVVLETLAPAERLAFVLHDMFAVPFDEIATIVDRSPEATRQLASRARRRVQGASVPDADLPASGRWSTPSSLRRDGDFEALVAVLDPDVVVRSDGGTAATTASVVAVRPRRSRVPLIACAAERRSIRCSSTAVPVSWSRLDGEVFSIMGFTVVDGKIVEIDALADPERLARIDLGALDPR